MYVLCIVRSANCASLKMEAGAPYSVLMGRLPGDSQLASPLGVECRAHQVWRVISHPVEVTSSNVPDSVEFLDHPRVPSSRLRVSLYRCSLSL